MRGPNHFRGRVLLAIALTAATVMSVVPAGSASASTPRGTETHASGADHGRIAVVPLDDRPVNMYAPQMTAKVAGFTTDFPPRSILGHFTTPGDGAAVARWLTAQGRADAYVVSVSMLAYGGLIASRTAAATARQAQHNVRAIKELRAARPHTPIYVFDTIQRLALTGLGGDKDYSDLVRQWAILYDQVVNLGQEQYRSQLDALRAQIPDQVINTYLATRKRNFDINRQMVREAADGTISYLVLGEDDTAPYGLERAERVQLQQLVAQLGVQDRVSIFPGADEIDAMLVARHVLQRLHEHPTVRVEYSGVPGSAWTPPLEDIPFDQNIARHITALGGTLVSADHANLDLMVNTPAGSDDNHPADLNRFVDRIGTLLHQSRNVVIDDPLYVNKADHDLVTRMQTKLDLTQPLSYSGWNTAGNSLGLAIAQGASRWAFLQRSSSGIGMSGLLVAGTAQADYLLHRIVLDDRWKNDVQPAAYAKAAQLGANPYDLTPAQVPVLQNFVRDHLVAATRDFYQRYFAGHQITLGQRGNHAVLGQVRALTGVHVQLPWPRLFETELEPHMTVARTQAHLQN